MHTCSNCKIYINNFAFEQFQILLHLETKLFNDTLRQKQPSSSAVIVRAQELIIFGINHLCEYDLCTVLAC